MRHTEFKTKFRKNGLNNMNAMTVLRNILVPTDFSQNSSQAIQYACDLAKQSGSNLHLLHVSKNELDSTDREKQLERVGASVDAKSELELATTKQVVVGNPASSIAEYARDREIDLIVMGSHGRTGLAHLALGSVAESVLREAPCPVTVLGPHDGENATLNHAVAVLEKMIGEGWQAAKEDGRSLMARKLVEKLRVASTSAILMVDELEHREWLRWQGGTWMTIEGNEFVEDFGPFFVEENKDNQAVDLIRRARKLRATDIHIDPRGDSAYGVRLRIDGGLQEYCRLDRSVADHLINQFRTMARLDIAEPFLPMEGRVQLPSSLSSTEVRLSSVPVTEGQAVALRLLDPQKVFRPLGELGFSDEALSSVQQMLKAEEGLILVTGPTGAGKTTTVYSMLETIGGLDKNIVSIEDPVEFTAPFVRQISVDEKHGLTMTRGLRTLLRMDPDALFLGEIRDPEAAQIAMRAAASGKYVFSTLHTRDIASTLSALLDLGLERQSIAANLSGIVNQRIVRRLCTSCRESLTVNPKARETFESNGIDVPEKLFTATGCSNCSGRGYRGRVGVFEVAVVDASFRSAIRDYSSRESLAKELQNVRIKTLQQDALAKAAQGLISFEEATGLRWLI